MRPRYISYIILIFIAAMIIFASSCAAYKDKICSQCPVVTKDKITLKDTTIYKDTTLYITQMSDPIYIDSPCKDLCDSMGKLKHFDIIKKDHGIKKEVKSIGNSVEFDCDADSLKQVIATLQHIRTVDSHTENTKTIEVNKLTKFQGFWIISGYLFWILVLILIIRFIIKFYTKI
ncbi:MAG TPA: hypothetical protein ACFYEK_01370 [Candidatus Wunengus sp. YC60]|uniref:hypothetical protein n=1 Tax=Candidatus Wunengus sp. YC60 TaxID=3367697 RepID=UPI0040280765